MVGSVTSAIGMKKQNVVFTCSEDDLRVVATRADLAAAEALFRARLILHHQAQGVTFRDPRGTFLVSLDNLDPLLRIARISILALCTSSLLT